MRAKSHFKGMVGGVVNEHSFVGTDEKEKLVAVHQARAETGVDAGLAGLFAVGIDGGVEGVVRGGDVMGEDGGGFLGFAPIVVAEGIGEALAVETNLPGEQAVGFERAARVFGNGGGVNAGESGERELAVVIELDEFVVLFGGIFGDSLIGIGDMVNEILAVGFEEGAHVVRERVHGFVGDEALGVVAPAEGRGQSEQEREYKQRQPDAKPETHQRIFSFAGGTPGRRVESPLWRRP